MRKIKVLLADDEPIILRGLRKLLHWHELGLEIVGEAYDGEELRQMIDTTKPDLVISDISMPGYTGIDIIREIHETNRDIKVVFISAYRDFIFAQDALKYGAIGYLVKPVDIDQLEETVQKAIRLIGDQSQRVREKEMAGRFEREKRNDSIEDLLVRMTNGDNSASAQLLELGVISRSKYFTVCFGELDDVMSDGSSWSEKGRKLLDFSIANVLDESVSETDSGIYFRKGELHCIFLQHDRLDEALSMSRDFHEKLNRYVKISFTLGVGKAVETLENADISAQSAMNSLQARFFTGWNCVIEGQQLQSDPEAKSRINDVLKKLVTALVTPGHENTEHTVSELMGVLRTLAPEGKHAAVIATYAAITRIRKELSDYGIFAGAADLDEHELLERLERFQTFEQMSEYVSTIIAKIQSDVAAKMGNKEYMLLTKVKAYIEEHYAENITLETMAALVYMNLYYFSSFFKKHTGENFKQYLTEVRMKHALSLLMQSDLMVYEIAERIGYNNGRQFSEMFKKRYGKLPLEYKQSIHQ